MNSINQIHYKGSNIPTPEPREDHPTKDRCTLPAGFDPLNREGKNYLCEIYSKDHFFYSTSSLKGNSTQWKKDSAVY